MLKKSLTWLNTHAPHSWTLGEAVLRGASPKEQKGLFTDHLTRAARMVERAVFIGGAVALGAAGAMAGLWPALGCLIAAKAVGYVAGRIAGSAVEKADHHFTPPALDARDYYGYTKLGRAVQKGNATAAKKLLEQGADTEASIPSGYGSETIAEAAVYSTPEIKQLFADAAAKKAAAETPPAPVAEAAKPQVPTP